MASWAVFALIDLIFTSLIAIGASWFFTSRYLARRTPDRLGRDDVALLREMFAILTALTAQDDLVPLGVSSKLRDRITAAIDRYAHSKELPQ